VRRTVRSSTGQALAALLALLPVCCRQAPEGIPDDVERRITGLCRDALVDSLPPGERHLQLTRSRVHPLGGKQYRLRGILAHAGTKRQVECKVVESGGSLAVMALSVAQL